jgi:hypothetical protein
MWCAQRTWEGEQTHRVRTTICHEFGHVWLHAPLWYEAGEEEQKLRTCSGLELQSRKHH